MMEVSIARTEDFGGPDPLVIQDDCDDTYTLGYNTLRIPGRAWQRDYASSPQAHGDVMFRAKLTQTAVEFAVIVKTATDSATQDAVEALYDALGQFTYVTTVTISGVQYTFSSDPADVTPQEQTLGMVSSKARLVGVTIPVYPVYGRT